MHRANYISSAVTAVASKKNIVLAGCFPFPRLDTRMIAKRWSIRLFLRRRSELDAIQTTFLRAILVLPDIDIDLLGHVKFFIRERSLDFFHEDDCSATSYKGSKLTTFWISIFRLISSFRKTLLRTRNI